MLSNNNNRLDYSNYEVLPVHLKFDGKFKHLLNEILNNVDQLELMLKLEMYLMHFISDFLKFAQCLVKEIIDDLFRKGRADVKKYQNRNLYSFNYANQNVSIKLAWNDIDDSTGEFQYLKTSTDFINQGHTSLNYYYFYFILFKLHA